VVYQERHIEMRNILYKYLIYPLIKHKFGYCGRNVQICRRGYFTYKNIFIGDDVYIGPNANFMSSVAKIIIENKVIIGPHVTIITGDHRTDVIGKYMYDVKEKLPQNDKDVIIDNDVWIGANVIILKGVKIGTGSVIGAGSIVTQSLELYSIYTGVPEQKIRRRFTTEQIKEHERILQLRQHPGEYL
jgi:acetyltransferase-like isoleucine patch superfamily enzyme